MKLNSLISQNKKTKNLIISLPVILILMLGFLSLISIQNVKASSPVTHTGVYIGQYCSFSGATVTCNNTGSYPIFYNYGESQTLMLYIDSYPNTAIITSITDNAGNTWVSANARTCTSGSSGYCEELWYVSQSSATAITGIVINYSPDATAVTLTASSSTTYLALNSFKAGISNGETNSLQVVKISDSQSLSQNIPSNSLVYVSTSIFSSGYDAGASGDYWNINTPTPLIWDSPICTSSCSAGLEINPWTGNALGANYGFNANVGMGVQTEYVTQSNTLNAIWSFSSGTTVPSSTTFSDIIFMSIWSQTGIIGNNCGVCSVTGGGTTLSTSYYTIHANQTYFYLTTTPSKGGMYLQNITTKIHGYTNTGIGKGTDTYSILVYSVPNTASITSNNPLVLVASLTKTITTGTTNLYTHWYPNTSIQNNSQFAIGIISKYTGLSIYESTGVNLNNDTTDALTNGIMNKITVYKANVTPDLFLGFIGYIPQSQTIQKATYLTTITCPSGSTCVNYQTTQIVTSTVTGLASPSGATLIITDLVTYLPIWIFPLIFGKMLGTTGLLYGLMLALILGIFMGLFPYWVIFLIIIMIYLLLR